MSDDMRAQRVVCAAMRNKAGLIVCGPRHYDAIMRAQINVSPADWPMDEPVEQGFVDQFGCFLTREWAHVIATANGQIIRRVGGDRARLFSENLY